MIDPKPICLHPRFYKIFVFFSVQTVVYFSSIINDCKVTTSVLKCLTHYHFFPVGWDCRIHRLLLCRGVRPPPNVCPGYDNKQSDGEVPAMLELWGMRSTPSLPSLPGRLWPRVVAPDKGPIYGLNRTKTVLLSLY